VAKKRGAVFLYQGHRCQSVRFRRTRGFEADTSLVTMPAAAFPDGFEVDEPKPDDMSAPLPPDASDVEAMLAGRAAELPRRLRFAGWLVIADLGDEVFRQPVVVGPLYVLRVDRVRRSERSSMAMLQVTLVDERYFWGARGFLRRWSYNRVRGDGSIALDSIRPDRKPFDHYDVAGQVVASLFRAPRLAHAPEDWRVHTGPVEFAPSAPAVLALGDVVRRWKVEEPCLRLDGSVALHKPGDGFVGYAPDGKGANTQHFPPAVILSKQTTSPGFSVELAYPDDYLLVLGKERIKTQALDDCEPVLVIPTKVRKAFLEQADVGSATPREFFGETVVPLNEKTVRALAGGRGLDWLRRWVFAPAEDQNAVGLDESVAQLLRDQAWRLWRIPGVDPPGVLGPTAGPGPNAHLLPLLPRAEQTANGRLPVTVEIYRFKVEHRNMVDTESRRTYLRARENMEELKKKLAQAAHRQAVPDPFNTRELSHDPYGSGQGLFGPEQDRLGFGTLVPGWTELLGAHTKAATGVSLEQANGMFDRARAIARAKAVDSGLGGAYEREFKDSLKARDTANGTVLTELYDLATRALELEGQIRQAKGTFDFGTLNEFIRDNPGKVDALFKGAEADFAEIMRRIAQKVDRNEQRSQTGAGPAEIGAGAYYTKNCPRDHDTHATVYSDRLGIVKTSRLAGWVEKEGVRGLQWTRFVPKPVRIVFGAVLRPAINAPPPALTTSQMSGGGPSRVPPELSDEITRFRRAYRRSPGGPVPVDPDQVPTGEGTVVRIDAHELIPLEGEGNTAELELQADEIAETRLRTPPKVEGATYVLGRPWPVQTDGLVSAVEIYSRPGGSGVETRVTVGSGRAPDPSPMRTRRRPPQIPPGQDAGRREGTAP
jgi:hypothetical protein